MNQHYYIAKVGEMWVTDCLMSINSIHLKDQKKYATHINQENAEYLKEKINAEIIEVNVTVEEKVI